MAMDKTTIIVCSVVGSLGVLSAILGFSAEGTKLTPNDILVLDDECIYPQNPALGLGVCATIFLLAAQITVTAVGGCCGCCKSRAIPSETKRIIGIVCAVASWIAAVIAWALLIQGAAWNANVARVTAPTCFYLKDGIFAGGAVLTLAATALGLTSFILLRRQTSNVAAPATAVHATGQPQFPPAPAAAAPNNKPGEQPPHAVVTMGQPQFWPAAAQPPPAGNAMGQGHQQFPPAAVAGGAPNKLGEQPPPTWVPTGHPQFSPPQAYAQPQPTSYPPQYNVQPQVYMHQMQVPVLPPPTSPPPQGFEQQAEPPAGARGEDLVKAGAKLLMQVVENALSSNDTATPTNGDGVQATDNGVAT